MEVKCPLDLGAVEDWDAMQAIWEHGFSQLHADMSEHPLIMAEPPFNIQSQREKMAEIMFETFKVPGFYLGRSPVLTAFSTGRASAIVVDMGASCTRVTPVYDGYVINSESWGGEGRKRAGDRMEEAKREEEGEGRGYPSEE